MIKNKKGQLTFDAKLWVSSKLENHQHEKKTSECDSSDAHHHVDLRNKKTSWGHEYRHTHTVNNSKIHWGDHQRQL